MQRVEQPFVYEVVPRSLVSTKWTEDLIKLLVRALSISLKDGLTFICKEPSGIAVTKPSLFQSTPLLSARFLNSYIWKILNRNI